MALRARQKLGKYRIHRRLATGGFAVVYSARDTVEGIDVALKIPHDHLLSRGVLADFRKEARLAAPLDHPNILPIKTADEVEGQFAIVTRLGKETLSERLTRRLGNRTILAFAEQLLQALAFAHRRRIIHCDLKPENLILFPENQLRLADFGIAKVAQKTVSTSGSGTIGYMAPEQAMGKPSMRSDVFSVGLLLYRMIARELPRWPFRWPMPGHERLVRSWHPAFIAIIRRALQVDERKRFATATQMLDAFQRVRKHAILGDRVNGNGHRTNGHSIS
jgi:serine/threonine-protein kinase